MTTAKCGIVYLTKKQRKTCTPAIRGGKKIYMKEENKERLLSGSSPENGQTSENKEGDLEKNDSLENERHGLSKTANKLLEEISSLRGSIKSLRSERRGLREMYSDKKEDVSIDDGGVNESSAINSQSTEKKDRNPVEDPTNNEQMLQDKIVNKALEKLRAEQRIQASKVAVDQFLRDNPEYGSDREHGDILWGKLMGKYKTFDTGNVTTVEGVLSFLEDANTLINKPNRQGSSATLTADYSSLVGNNLSYKKEDDEVVLTREQEEIAKLVGLKDKSRLLR